MYPHSGRWSSEYSRPVPRPSRARFLRSPRPGRQHSQLPEDRPTAVMTTRTRGTPTWPEECAGIDTPVVPFRRIDQEHRRPWPTVPKAKNDCEESMPNEVQSGVPWLVSSQPGRGPPNESLSAHFVEKAERRQCHDRRERGEVPSSLPARGDFRIGIKDPRHDELKADRRDRQDVGGLAPSRASLGNRRICASHGR